MTRLQLLVDLKEPFIEITVSPLASETTIRVLDISWNCGVDWRPGDWVALYNRRPKCKGDVPLFSQLAPTSKGWLRSGIQEKRVFPLEAHFQRRCLGYWAAYWRESRNKTVAITCLMTNPTWMEDNWDDIKDLRLNEVFLPGTHDSGSFFLQYKPFAPRKYDKYVFNQDETIIEQLIHGSRYLDLRISNYPATGFWINHQIVRTHILQFIVEDILLFLENTREIVVIDLHGFPIGFRAEPETHFQFVEFMNVNLGQHMAPFSGYDTTLEEIRNSGKRLIVAHKIPQIFCRYPNLFWYSIKQKWGNAQRVEDLKAYLVKEVTTTHGNGMWAAMAELTSKTWYVLTNKGDLRSMMDTCNHNVTEWFRDEWGVVANIVAVDFLRSTGIVSAAIRWNRLKGGAQRDEPKVGRSLEATNVFKRPLISVKKKEYFLCIAAIKREKNKDKSRPWWDLGRRNLEVAYSSPNDLGSDSTTPDITFTNRDTKRIMKL